MATKSNFDTTILFQLKVAIQFQPFSDISTVKRAHLKALCFHIAKAEFASLNINQREGI
jgi:hypothetical protein